MLTGKLLRKPQWVMEAEITGAEPPKRHQSPGAVRGDAQVPARLSLRGLVACLLCQLQCLLQEGGRGSGVRPLTLPNG